MRLFVKIVWGQDRDASSAYAAEFASHITCEAMLIGAAGARSETQGTPQ